MRVLRAVAGRHRMYAYYLGIIGVGLIGLAGAPSLSVTETLGRDGATWLYSTGLVFVAALAAACRGARLVTAEARAVVGIAACTLVHGASLLAQGESGLQTGLRLVIAVPMFLDWAAYRRGEHIDRLVEQAEAAQ